MEIQHWLESTFAKEAMVKKVVTLHLNVSLAEAAAILLQEKITGAPVVDSSNRCVGVLSVVDILGAEEKVAEARQEVAESSFFSSGLILPTSVYAEKLSQVRDKITAASEQPVANFMTSNIVSVRETAPLFETVRDMVDAHIHRVLVLNKEEKLLGIITTIDVLASLLKAGQSK